jgi:hypothetical protein
MARFAAALARRALFGERGPQPTPPKQPLRLRRLEAGRRNKRT